MRIAVIGSGISGLASAWFACDFSLATCEAALLNRPVGVMQLALGTAGATGRPLPPQPAGRPEAA